MTTASLWLSFMLLIAPREPDERLHSVAQTVVEATSDPREQALLLTVSFYETTWGRRGIPFGVSSLRRANPTPAECATFALTILRRAQRMCPRSVAAQLGFYHHGRGCNPDRYSIAESVMVSRMQAWIANHGSSEVRWWPSLAFSVRWGHV